ncbi:uncharacterized protein LOC144124109 [Amblyomma americanum]
MWCSALYVSLESFGVTGSMYLGIVRFNDFRNEYQRDVNFVLVADTATKGLRTAITFMFLGHLASSVGIDVRMLVGIDSDFVVSVMPQAMSLVPYHQLWSHVHCLWLLSTMLPKFLIVPDIVSEVLSAGHPFILLNRTLIHFFICVCLLMVSVAVCSPGGAYIAAIIVHNHDQNLRFVMLFLESIVFLQFYGARRFDIVCRMMTGREGSVFVKICLASIIPVMIITLLSAKITSQRWTGLGQYPIWIYGIITWFDLVELSCIPVFAIVFMNETNLSVSSCLMPLPTWVPVSWQDAMVYRQTLVVKGFDSDVKKRGTSDKPRAARQVLRRSSKKSKHASSSSSSSSTEFMASAMTFVTDREYAEPGTGTSSLAARRAKMGVASLSGTLHAPRRLSSLRQSAARDRLAQQQALAALDDPRRLFLEAEGTGTSGPQAFAVSRIVAPSVPTFQESSQIPGVILTPAAAAVEPPAQLSPEASDIPQKVAPINAVHNRRHNEELSSKAQAERQVLASEKPIVGDKVVGASSTKTNQEKKSPNDAPLGSFNKDAANMLTKKPQESQQPLPEATIKNRKFPCEQPVTREGPDAFKSQEPREAVAAELSKNRVDGKDVDVAVEQGGLQTRSRQSRPSLQELLLLNKPLPSAAEDKVLDSDVFIRVRGSSKSSNEPAVEKAGRAGQKTASEIRSKEIRNRKGASANVPVGGLRGQQALFGPGEPLKMKGQPLPVEQGASAGGFAKNIASSEKPKPGQQSPAAQVPGGKTAGNEPGKFPRPKRAKHVTEKKQSKHIWPAAHKAPTVPKETAENVASGIKAPTVADTQAPDKSMAGELERKVGQSAETASRRASVASHSRRAATLRTAAHKRGTALSQKSSARAPKDAQGQPKTKKNVGPDDVATLRKSSFATKTTTGGSVHKRVSYSEPQITSQVGKKPPDKPAVAAGPPSKLAQDQPSLNRKPSGSTESGEQRRQPDVISVLKEKRWRLEKADAERGAGSSRELPRASTSKAELPGSAAGGKPNPAVKEAQLKNGEKLPVNAEGMQQQEQKHKHHKKGHKLLKKEEASLGASPMAPSVPGAVGTLSVPTEPEHQSAPNK